jgi:hypothetical protein
MKATCFSETSIDFQQSTRNYIPEDLNHNDNTTSVLLRNFQFIIQ